jgi:general secretion pathway protein D
MKALVVLLFIFGSHQAFSQTIAEKLADARPKEGTEAAAELSLSDVNQQLASLRSALQSCYAEVQKLHKEGSQEEEFCAQLQKVNALRGQIVQLETRWRASAVSESKRDEEGYALWDQEETTLGQLVMEYGALDFLYLVPPDMASMKLNMHSNIPIPRESWSEVLEIILGQNGVGVKRINTYARQLYVLKQDPSAIQNIAARPEDLLLIPPQARVFYVFSPPVEQVKSVVQFFERFCDSKQTFVYQIGPKLALVAFKEEVEKLLQLYDSVWRNAKGKVSRVTPVSKMAVKEMEKILQSFFGETIEKSRPPFGKIEQEGLTVFSLSQGNALILIGSQEVVDRAAAIVHDTEEQLQDPAEMTVYLYNCRHSDPNDLVKVLGKVYASLLIAAPEGKEMEVNYASQGAQFKTPDGYAPTPPLVVAPQPLKPGSSARVEVDQGTDHFIADPKTGNLLMVVRRDVLVKIKDLLRKLDVPKKMVQIEVMLFEKRINNQNSFGLNLLKVGGDKNGVRFASAGAPSGSGVLQYLLSGGKSKHFPAYDFIYSFLMTQEDIQLNAAPSITTVNQTPATISLVEEISINNGAAPVDTNKGIAFEKSFTRAQYGITIVMTPTIHPVEEEDPLSEGKGFVTLQTNITFDTTKSSPDDRPLVDRRHIENEVRVHDGQTVILGGLRRKASQDSADRIPFLGEIPGFGKLFGSTKLTNHNTEMFFFITPKIILDPQEEFIQLRTEELKKRPGDMPEFLKRVMESRNKEQRKFFNQSLKILFGNNYG